MNFLNDLPKLVAAFDSAGIGYALIGGLAMAVHGVQRTTLDADFILLSENLTECDLLLKELGYMCEFQSENVSHYVSTNRLLVRLDFLHAFRPATLSMLKRAQRLPILENCDIPVVQVEDLIGLKIQASVNDPDRYLGDWNDINMLIDHAAKANKKLDWELVQDYLSVFDLGHKLEGLKARYGKVK